MSNLGPEGVSVNRETPKERKHRESLRTAYKGVDAGSGGMIWPPDPLIMTRPEAISAGKRLWRHFAGRAWPGTWRSGRGNHRIYPRGTVMLVNPGLGWRRFVHDLSHALYDQMTTHGHSTHGPRLWVKGQPKPILSKAVLANYRTAKRADHSDDHAQLEKAMARMVIENGWLDGKLKAKPKEPRPKPSVRERNEAKVAAGLARWTAKLRKAEADVRRAKKKISELRKKKKRYDKIIEFKL